MQHLDRQTNYIIRTQGRIDAQWVDWCAPVTWLAAPSEATAFRLHTDQAGIVGLVRHLHSLGIVLLSVERTDNED